MNKYQESLNFLCEHAMEWRDDYDWDENNVGEYVPMNEYDLKEYIEPLQELIDKATPKKKEERLFKESIKYHVCPTCHSIILGHNKYCENCGQRIDGLER